MSRIPLSELPRHPPCSVKCLRADQNCHCRPECEASKETKALQEAFQRANIVIGPLSTPTSPESAYTLQTYIARPFTRLVQNTWLHGRSRHDTFRLLIDAYRWRVEEDQVGGTRFFDSLYQDPFNGGRRGFRQWMTLVEGCLGILPEWWTTETSQQCYMFAQAYHDWSVDRVVRVWDIQRFYGADQEMASQLAIFSETVVGTAGGLVSTSGLLRMMVKEEWMIGLDPLKRIFNSYYGVQENPGWDTSL
ncbi:MYND finger domain-containing protein [Penicillium chermesinum]|nr:MYND finger domain-containing protein [Penicillium chermesinum]